MDHDMTKVEVIFFLNIPRATMYSSWTVDKLLLTFCVVLVVVGLPGSPSSGSDM